MKVHEAMCTTVCAIEAETTVQQAAALMAELDVGVLPVLRNSRLIGIVTDRDITVRATANALPADAPVRMVMTHGVHACHADDDLGDVLLDMQVLQLRRLPVEDDDDKLVGMFSLGDLLAGGSDEEAGRVLRSICRTPRRHSGAPRREPAGAVQGTLASAGPSRPWDQPVPRQAPIMGSSSEDIG